MLISVSSQDLDLGGCVGAPARHDERAPQLALGCPRVSDETPQLTHSPPSGRPVPLFTAEPLLPYLFFLAARASVETAKTYGPTCGLLILAPRPY